MKIQRYIRDIYTLFPKTDNRNLFVEPFLARNKIDSLFNHFVMVISLLCGWNPSGVEEKERRWQSDQESKRYAPIFYYSSKEIRRLHNTCESFFCRSFEGSENNFAILFFVKSLNEIESVEDKVGSETVGDIVETFHYSKCFRILIFIHSLLVAPTCTTSVQKRDNPLQ